VAAQEQERGPEPVRFRPAAIRRSRTCLRQLTQMDRDPDSLSAVAELVPVSVSALVVAVEVAVLLRRRRRRTVLPACCIHGKH